MWHAAGVPVFLRVSKEKRWNLGYQLYFLFQKQTLTCGWSISVIGSKLKKIDEGVLIFVNKFALG
jgi:hypothetical protein